MKWINTPAMLILSANWAMAQDVPHYDSQLYCKMLSGGYSDPNAKDFLLKACIETQDKSADQIKRVIAYVDSATIKQCDAMASSVVGGFYQVFVGCLVMNITQRILDGTLEITSPKK
jgi:hypothetical protein